MLPLGKQVLLAPRRQSDLCTRVLPLCVGYACSQETVSVRRPRASSMALIAAADSGPKHIAPAFSYTCATLLKPGIGTVAALFAQIQDRAP